MTSLRILAVVVLAIIGAMVPPRARFAVGLVAGAIIGYGVCARTRETR